MITGAELCNAPPGNPRVSAAQALAVATQVAHARLDDGGLWVFGYGSLMWRPGFAFLERRGATLIGYRRRFCIFSHHHRGTAAVPGLVLGLDAGGRCPGVAFRVAADDVAASVDYLSERELIGYAYRPMAVPLDLSTADTEVAESVTAYTFVADPEHPHYAGDLGIDETARRVMSAEGKAGLNRDYLIQTVRHLAQSGVAEPDLVDLLDRVERMTGEIERGGGI